jgi:hypothetical protein
MSGEYQVVGSLDPATAQATRFEGAQILVHDDDRDQVLIAVPKAGGDE